MYHFRGDPSSETPKNGTPPIPTPTPSILQYIKKELATFHPRVKDRRALAASSSAIALSIASPGCCPPDVTLNEPGPSKESVWKVAYGAAKIAVEVVNESSDMFPPLKAVVGAIFILVKNCDQTAANAEQIKDVEERVQSLGEVLASPVGDRDTEEKARRETLRRKLVGIVAKLGSLSEQNGLLRFLKNADHADTLNGFVQDLAYAVTDYQTSLQQSIYENTKRIEGSTKEIGDDTKRIGETTKKIDENTQNLIEATELELLGKLGPVRNAGYQAGHHDTCLRGTRESVLDRIMRWAEDPQERHVFWLNGLAGTGKSTIAQTFSQTVAKNGTLGASFFCSRDYLDRKELKNIFPTLAYQLACRYPSFRTRVIQAIKQDPSVAQSSLLSQLKELIVDPLSSTETSCIIVVDALDECVDDQPASAILSVLARYVKQLPSVKFFITGRPEPRIRTGFRLPLLEPLTEIFLLHEVELSSVDDDIRLYLREKLSAAAKRRSDLDLTDPWPSEEDLATLTKKSSGLFIFASTLARFIESEHHEPDERLRLIVTPPESTVHEGRAGIDPLYTQVLIHAFSDVKETTAFANLRRVLGAVILAFNPLSRTQIAKILGIKASLISTTLRHLHSVLLVPSETSKEIRIFHKSFPDFLQDRDRCPDSKFFIDPSGHHADIALGCLHLLKKLKPNPCNLPDFVMNRDVVNLPKLLDEKVGSALRYACGYWAMHVRSSPTTSDHATRLIASATEFFKKSAVPWIEVMSLENRLESVIHNIQNLLYWIGTVDVPTSDLRSLAQDTLRFTMHFFHLLQRSSSHIHHSAIPLSPSSSLFYRATPQQNTAVGEYHGRPNTWGAVVRTIKGDSEGFTCMTTFGHKIAAACDNGTVGIYDSVTGALRLSLSAGDPVQTMKGSPDGSILFCTHQEPSITFWDIQTGGLIHTFVLKFKVEGIAVSSNGRYLACGLSDGSVKMWEIASRKEIAVVRSVSAVNHICWMEPEELLVVARGALVHILDVSGKVLRGFELRDPVRGLSYSKEFHQLAIVTATRAESTVITMDPRTDALLSSETQHHLSCFAFSRTAQELVCGTEAPGLTVFNLSRPDWKWLNYPATIASISTLSNGTVVVNIEGSGIQLLSLDGKNDSFPLPAIPALTVDAFDEGRIIAVHQTTRDRILLLELATMSELFALPLNTRKIPTDRSPVLCASLENKLAIYNFEEGGRERLELWSQHGPRWTVIISEQPSAGGISPNGSRLVSLHDTHNSTHIYVRDLQNGRLQAHLLVDRSWPTHPLEIKFESEDRFYSKHDAFRIPYIISSQKPGSSSRSIVCHGQLPLVGQSRRYYEVDDTREWVVGSSKKICWIPPGYIGSNHRSYCWAGHTLVMAGQDGTLRKLTFREQF